MIDEKLEINKFIDAGTYNIQYQLGTRYNVFFCPSEFASHMNAFTPQPGRVWSLYETLSNQKPNEFEQEAKMCSNEKANGIEREANVFEREAKHVRMR